MIFIITFICGILYELTSVYWVLSTERLQPWKSALCSMVQGLVMLTGVGQSIKDWHIAVFYIAGYSLGSALGILIERRRLDVKKIKLIIPI